ncbi:hypothetical protein WJX74_003356 [Apatococcus lobatus]|uniref:Uncharacterized protein n=1 Tax=Apatococcus lobatus TaxID=904363 RepID=A0AAW1QD41_9CHLO
MPPESQYRQEPFIEELGKDGSLGARGARGSPLQDRTGKENAGINRDAELRLQQLEGNQAHLAMDLQSMKGMGALMVGWRDQMETASAHLAAVLGLVERDGKAVRSELEDLRAHKDQSEAAITQMQALVLHLQTQLGRGQGTGRPALEMGRLRDDIKRLEADSRKLSEGMSGQLQVRNSAGERTMAKCSQLEEQQAALRYVQRMQGEQLNLMQSWLGDLIDQYNTRPQQQSFPAPDLPLRLCDKLDSLGSGDRSSLATSQGDMQLQLHTSSAVQPRVQSPSTSGGGALGTSRSLLLTNRTTPGTARAPDAHPLDFSDGMSSASDSSPQRTAEPSPSRRHSQAARKRTPSKRAVPALTGLALKPRGEEDEPEEPAPAAAVGNKASERSQSSLLEQVAQLQLQLQQATSGSHQAAGETGAQAAPQQQASTHTPDAAQAAESPQSLPPELPSQGSRIPRPPSSQKPPTATPSKRRSQPSQHPTPSRTPQKGTHATAPHPHPSSAGPPSRVGAVRTGTAARTGDAAEVGTHQKRSGVGRMRRSSFCIGENGSIPMETSASPAAGGAIPATKQSIVKNASRNTSTPPTAPRTRVVDPRQSPPPIASGIAKRGTRPRSTPLGAGGVNSNPAASRLSATHFNGSITRSTDQGGPRAATRSKLGSPTRSCGSVLSSSKAGSQSMQQLSKPHGPAAGTAEPPSPSHSVQSGMTSPGSANRSRQMGFPTPARRSMQGSQVGSQAAKPVKRAFGSSLSRGLGAEPSGADRNGPSPMNSSRSNIRLSLPSSARSAQAEPDITLKPGATAIVPGSSPPKLRRGPPSPTSTSRPIDQTAVQETDTPTAPAAVRHSFHSSGSSSSVNCSRALDDDLPEMGEAADLQTDERGGGAQSRLTEVVAEAAGSETRQPGWVAGAVRWGRLSQTATEPAPILLSQPLAANVSDVAVGTDAGPHPAPLDLTQTSAVHVAAADFSEPPDNRPAGEQLARQVAPSPLASAIPTHPTLAPTPPVHRYTSGCDDSPGPSPNPAESASSMGDSMLMSPPPDAGQLAESGFASGGFSSPSYPPTAGVTHSGRPAAAFGGTPPIARSSSKLSESSLGAGGRLRSFPADASASQARRGEFARRGSMDVSRRPAGGSVGGPRRGSTEVPRQPAGVAAVQTPTSSTHPATQTPMAGFQREATPERSEGSGSEKKKGVAAFLTKRLSGAGKANKQSAASAAPASTGPSLQRTSMGRRLDADSQADGAHDGTPGSAVKPKKGGWRGFASGKGLRK